MNTPAPHQIPPATTPVEELAQALGAKLALFIFSLNLPIATKDALVAILPLFTLEELEHLAQVMETLYLDQKTHEVEHAFKETLFHLYKKDEERQKQHLIETLSKLQKVMIDTKV